MVQHAGMMKLILILIFYILKVSHCMPLKFYNLKDNPPLVVLF